MTIILKFQDNTTTVTTVSKTFTSELITDCFVGKDYKGFGIVNSWAYASHSGY